MNFSTEDKNEIQKDSQILKEMCVFHELTLTSESLELKILEQKCSLEEEKCAFLLNLLSGYFSLEVSHVCWEGGNIALYVDEKN